MDLILENARVDPSRFHETMRLLLQSGAALTSRAAVALGDRQAVYGGGIRLHGSMFSRQDQASAGFNDAWALVHRHNPGYTWGQADDLLNPLSTLSERDDYVWFRGEHLSVQSVRLTGDQPADRIPSLANPSVLLWPSDHAGVSARLRIK